MRWLATFFKQFAETEVKPLAQETDETEVFPAETVAKMGKIWIHGHSCTKGVRRTGL